MTAYRVMNTRTDEIAADFFCVQKELAEKLAAILRRNEKKAGKAFADGWKAVEVNDAPKIADV